MQQTIKILLADDEPDILEIIGFNLEKAGYFVYKASNGNDAVTIAQKVQPDFFILDVMMPGKTGIEVCNILRNNNQLKDKPIIMLTALNDEQSHITGLEAGADDYIAKPISPKLLVSRVKALLRRTTNEDYKKIIQVGNLTIDPLKYTVTSNGNNVVLARKEFELLHLLASKPERVFLRDEILFCCYG
jgi:two-component system alkaline phosphatase synthesis response regulator PhoP